MPYESSVGVSTDVGEVSAVVGGLGNAASALPKSLSIVALLSTLDEVFARDLAPLLEICAVEVEIVRPSIMREKSRCLRDCESFEATEAFLVDRNRDRCG